MATKNNPGSFDCYAKAEGDEPMFVLLARDPEAPALVRRWAKRREQQGEDPAKVREALDCAEDMVLFRKEREARNERAAVLAKREEIRKIEAAKLAQKHPASGLSQPTTKTSNS